MLLDTTTALCSVALSINGSLHSEREIEGQQHAAQLTTLISECAQAAGIPLKELSAVCVAAGPGSYTGLRIGIATAKGLCFALNLPLIAVDSMFSLADAMRQTQNNSDAEAPSLYLPTLDARRNDAYCALYDADLQPILPIDCRTMQPDWLDVYLPKYQIFTAGNAAQKVPKKNNINIMPTPHSARNMLRLAEKYFSEGKFEPLAQFEPLYIKPPLATQARHNAPLA